jgi:hypothetical protein
MKLCQTLIATTLAIGLHNTQARANEIEFVCYNETLRLDGLYDSKTGVRAVPVELAFNTVSQKVARKGWNCSTVIWGDPHIFFVCDRRIQQGMVVLSANLFDRVTGKLSDASVSETDFASILNDFTHGETETTRRSVRYDQCHKKQF